MPDSSHYKAGRQHYDALQYDKALMHFRLCLEEQGSKPAVYSMMAHCHYTLEHFAQALECCEMATQSKERLKDMDLAGLKRKVTSARQKAWKRWRALFDAGLSQRFESDIIGESDAIKAVLKQVEQAAPRNATVLIAGETGVGKELVAHQVHNSSPRSDEPFISVNCGAFIETLLESELFGHVEGAFTGAIRDKDGQMVLANGGSFFLDEVGEMSPQTQVKLLRVIQTKHVLPVGSTEKQKIDVRLIAATNRNLGDMVETGQFREDLFYRLNVLPVFVPPLRERKEDIMILAGHFLSKYMDEEGLQHDPMVTDEALEALINHTWPGNVRELENVIHRLLMSSLEKKSKLGVDDILRTLSSQGTLHSDETEDLEALLPDALRHTEWDLHKTASFLGVDLQTLKRMMRKQHLKP